MVEDKLLKLPTLFGVPFLEKPALLSIKNVLISAENTYRAQNFFIQSTNRL